MVQYVFPEHFPCLPGKAWLDLHHGVRDGGVSLPGIEMGKSLTGPKIRQDNAC